MKPIARSELSCLARVGAWVAVIGWAWLAASGEGIDLSHRPVADVIIEGLKRVEPQLVLNQVRLAPGDVYDPEIVEQDIVRITHLGRFSSVQARVEPLDDGSVVVAYVVQEQPLLQAVEVVGNKQVSDQKLLSAVVIRRGDPVDRFLIDRAIHEIKRVYEKEGYFVTDVTVDEQHLAESSILIFRVREGPTIRIRDVRFEGNEVFTSKQLSSKIQSRPYLWILRKGQLNRDHLDADSALLRDFYHGRGYLDAQIGRRIDLAPNQKDAVVVFVVDEGPMYTVASVRIDGNEVFSPQQIIEALKLRAGDVFSSESLGRSRQAVVDLYGTLGYIEANVQIERLFFEDRPMVELLVSIEEGKPYWVGTVSVKGNRLTQDKVIYRQLRGLNPGRRFDGAALAKSERRLRESSLFDEAKITILGEPDDRYRDVLIDVKEANTGRLSFGAGISSDAGLLGAIDLSQRNFDIANPPGSFADLIRGRGFRGAGQTFNLALQPGNETSRYSVGFREPYFLDSEFSFGFNFLFFEREREDWDEQRLGGTISLGHRFGDVWSAAVRFRGEQIEISDIDPSAPVDVFAVNGETVVTSIGLNATRNTTDSRLFPTRGNLLQMGITRSGAMGGDFDFTRADAEFRQFWTVDEDFYGRRTVLSLRVEVGYILEEDEAPIFERFYAGGHRTFRGFSFRGVGPRGIRNDTGTLGDDPVGGDWLFLAGLEYNFPIYQEIVRGVFFTDTGTVQDDVGMDQYRVSIGAGVRLKIPFLGQAPFALDFAVPLLKEDGDDSQLFSFDLALPF